MTPCTRGEAVHSSSHYQGWSAVTTMYKLSANKYIALKHMKRLASAQRSEGVELL